MDYTYHDIISRLAIRQTSNSSWIARCPCPIHRDGDRHPSASLFIGTSGDLIFKCYRGCTAKQVADEIGIPLKYWNKTVYQSGAAQPSKRPEYFKYEYTDLTGKRLYRVFRQKDRKFFFQQRTIYDAAGNEVGVTNCLEGGFYIPKSGKLWEKVRVDEIPANAIEVPECPRTLYKITHWFNQKDRPVFVVEGEKKVEKLMEFGFLATCNSGGAGKFVREHARLLRQRRVIIIPDNDEKGFEHAAIVAGWCVLEHALSVRVVPLSSKFPEKYDIFDYCTEYPEESLKGLKELEAATTAGYSTLTGFEKLKQV